ncbi:MAG: FIG004556: membrane metalloprotease [uncultured Acidimicrobiales bacterium]|uniref:FIG004556: membrane metalloprotease n=1 Tax=uncultured Acidimicrobiales bacterium TaxID=310071 RepID=A0A6J4HDY9_9ACTN|nr:MAG: FIG004556: membrane metalloprotease [uncultured Acidimicrobiales bacterium]
MLLWLAIREGMLGRDGLIFFAVLVPSIILHEVSHGYAALAFGDTTARDAGRLTLNPVAHIDPFGTLLLPALMVLTTGSAFGFAKPVPVRPGMMRNPRTSSLLTSLAGPATNLVLVGLATLAIRVLRPEDLVLQVLFFFGLSNVVLAVFNLLPVPPLDGSALIEWLIPQRFLHIWWRFRTYSMVILLAIFLLQRDAFARLINPVAELWYGWLF